MCGIAGFVLWQGFPSPQMLERQLALLTHRGPDSSGNFKGSRALIGQTRLAIIDLVTGDPPIANEDDSVGVALNGEIYNFRELRDGLVARGHRFRSQGDTEVIAHLAEDLEPRELARSLNGMFAVAVWDERKERLILIRDRFGKKPLYYWHGSGGFVFASEIKALIAHDAVPSSLQTGAIDAYLTFGYVPTPMTFYEGILSVPPGHVVVVEPGKEPQVSEYWLPPLVAPGRDARIEMSLGDAAGEVRRLLEESVERRLISDVPLGAFLSGGIDSSAIVGIMASKLDRPVSTFTIGFTDEHGFDERPYARTIAERFSTDHHEFVVEPKAVDLIERLVWHHDQPFGDSSAVPTFLLSELTRTEVTVALSGDGGDELFAGYERFAAALALARYRRVPRKLRGALEAAVDRGRPETLGGRVGSLQRFTRRADLDTLEAYRSWVAFAPDETLRALLPGGSDWALAQYRSTWARSAGAETLDRLQDLNIRTYLVDDLLVKADRMSMAHALEVRSPFLDPALADFALRLPPSARLRGPVLKRVLKHALRDLLPRQILHRRKKGFGVPLDRWFREDLKSFMEAKLGSPNASIRSHLVPAELDRLLAEHDRRTENHGQLLWALLTLEVFLERQAW